MVGCWLGAWVCRSLVVCGWLVLVLGSHPETPESFPEVDGTREEKPEKPNTNVLSLGMRHSETRWMNQHRQLIELCSRCWGLWRTIVFEDAPWYLHDDHSPGTPHHWNPDRCGTGRIRGGEYVGSILPVLHGEVTGVLGKPPVDILEREWL